MEVKKITQEDIPELIRFGEEVFPERKKNYGDIIHFVMDNRIKGYTGGVILLDEKKNIRGQSLFTSANLWYNGEKVSTGWGYELIVDESLRDNAWGVEIMLGTRKLFPGTCATGSNPTALKLNEKLGCKLIGEIRKYVIPSSFLRLPLNFLPSKKRYPEEVNNFVLITSAGNIVNKEFYNKNLIEGGRDFEFLKWRYFTTGFKDYNFYHDSVGNWFVVRKIKYKGIGMLLVSDFRCSLEKTDNFNIIFKTINRLANIMRIPFILFGSSHKSIDEVLEKRHGKSIGRPRPIIVSKQLKRWINEERITNREFCLITFGDSDGEWNW